MVVKLVVVVMVLLQEAQEVDEHTETVDASYVVVEVQEDRDTVAKHSQDALGAVALAGEDDEVEMDRGVDCKEVYVHPEVIQVVEEYIAAVRVEVVGSDVHEVVDQAVDSQDDQDLNVVVVAYPHADLDVVEDGQPHTVDDEVTSYGVVVADVEGDGTQDVFDILVEVVGKVHVVVLEEDLELLDSSKAKKPECEDVWDLMDED